MKNKLFNFTLIVALIGVLALSFTWTGCSSVTGGKSLLGSVKEVIVGDDYESAGRTVGEAGYIAYTLLKDNPKYDRYRGKCEELYEALDRQESEVQLGTINQVALEVCQVALTAKYGPAKATLIMSGIRIGGAIADRIIARKVDTVAADQFIKGFKAGIDDAKSGIPAPIVIEKEKPKYIVYKKGTACELKFTTRNIDEQIIIANELLAEDGLVDKDEPRTEKKPYNKWDNINALILRGEKLRELGIKTLNVWIADVGISADGKLESIKFLHQDFDDSIVVTDCVSCHAITEKAE